MRLMPDNYTVNPVLNRTWA